MTSEDACASILRIKYILHGQSVDIWHPMVRDGLACIGKFQE